LGSREQQIRFSAHSMRHQKTPLLPNGPFARCFTGESRFEVQGDIGQTGNLWPFSSSRQPAISRASQMQAQVEFRLGGLYEGLKSAPEPFHLLRWESKLPHDALEPLSCTPGQKSGWALGLAHRKNRARVRREYLDIVTQTSEGHNLCALVDVLTDAGTHTHLSRITTCRIPAPCSRPASIATMTLP
jgi:hypothetical protein